MTTMEFLETGLRPVIGISIPKSAANPIWKSPAGLPFTVTIPTSLSINGVPAYYSLCLILNLSYEDCVLVARTGFQPTGK